MKNKEAEKPNLQASQYWQDVISELGNKAPQSAIGQTETVDFQTRVQDWLLKCFGEAISKDVVERNDRFLEESMELIQSLDYTADRAHALVDYVFGRPKGEPFQECGGVMVTLAALCSATELDMTANGETEYNRINTPEMIEKIRKKQASKPTGSALPIPQRNQPTTHEATIENLASKVVELEGENERLKKALEDIEANCDNTNDSHEQIWRIAQTALSGLNTEGI